MGNHIWPNPNRDATLLGTRHEAEAPSFSIGEAVPDKLFSGALLCSLFIVASTDCWGVYS